MKAEWQTKPLGEVCDVVNGGTPKTSVSNYWNGNHRWITPAEMGKLSSPYVCDTQRTLTELGLRDCSASMLPRDSVILSSRAPIGHLVINTEPMATNQGCKGLIPGDQVHYKYLYYYLSSIVDLLNALGTGATFRELSGGKLKEVQITFPTYKQQLRIIEILDEAFAGIAAAKVNTEKNLQNARELFENCLQSVLANRRSGWTKTRLGEEVDLLSGFPFKSTLYTESNESVRLLRGDNIIQGRLRWDDAKKWPIIDVSNYQRYTLESGDVVLAMDRPWIKAGLKRAQIGEDDLPCLLVQRTARLRGKSQLDNQFLFYLISSQSFADHILGVQTGIGVPHISGQQIKDFQFLRPPLDEQRNIGRKLTAIHTETRRLESIYTKKLAALDALKKSLLHEAFSGKL